MPHWIRETEDRWNTRPEQEAIIHAPRTRFNAMHFPPTEMNVDVDRKMARSFLRQAEHDISVARNDFQGCVESDQWACYKLHQVRVFILRC